MLCIYLMSLGTSFVVKDMAPQAPNLKLVAVAPSKNLNVLMPKPTLMNKAKHDPAHAAGGWQKVILQS